jgi:hypothetical protein
MNRASLGQGNEPPGYVIGAVLRMGCSRESWENSLINIRRFNRTLVAVSL